MSFPYDYVPPAKYPGLSDDELVDVLCTLTQDVIEARRDLAGLRANHSARFYQVFMDSHGESVAARNRLAENDTFSITNEIVECEANIAANEDLCALIRTILKQRRNYG